MQVVDNLISTICFGSDCLTCECNVSLCHKKHVSVFKTYSTFLLFVLDSFVIMFY